MTASFDGHGYLRVINNCSMIKLFGRDIDELRNSWLRVELIGGSCFAKETVYFGLRVLREPGRPQMYALLDGAEQFVGRAYTKKFQIGQPWDCRQWFERPDSRRLPGGVPTWERR